MFKIRLPYPLAFLRRRPPARTPIPVQLPKVALPLLFASPAPRLVPVAMKAEEDASPPRSGFVL